MNWIIKYFNEQQHEAIKYCKKYAIGKGFSSHNSRGRGSHNAKMMISKLANLLDEIEDLIDPDLYDEEIGDRLIDFFSTEKENDKPPS